MKLLLHSRFWPSVGGIETVAELLARECVKQNVAVTIVTDVARPNEQKSFPFPVYYQPRPWVFLDLLRKHDVFVHFNVSLRAIWPLLIVRRPFIAVHQGCYQINRFGDRNWREQLKLRIAKHAAANIAASDAISKTIGIECHVVLNPYDRGLFRTQNDTLPDKDLIFVGRLVSDKGADVLIRSMSALENRGLIPELTVVGDGPERFHLEKLTESLGLEDRITFAGAKPQPDVARLLRQHKILVVPSLWNEPFGVVALEGIACGCVVIGTSGGGLPEAIGDCGLTVPNGDAEALALGIERLLTEKGLAEHLRARASDHLAKHRPASVAQRYLDIIAQVLSK
jgi:glycogen synthase